MGSTSSPPGRFGRRSRSPRGRPAGDRLAICGLSAAGPALRWARRRGPGRLGWARAAWRARTRCGAGWGFLGRGGGGHSRKPGGPRDSLGRLGSAAALLGRGLSWASEGEGAEGGPGRRLCTQRLDSVERQLRPSALGKPSLPRAPLPEGTFLTGSSLPPLPREGGGAEGRAGRCLGVGGGPAEGEGLCNCCRGVLSHR